MKHTLAPEGLNPDLVLPFLLSWYGWLSKEKAAVAIEKCLAEVVLPAVCVETTKRLRLTQKGIKSLNIDRFKDDELGVGYLVAFHLRTNDMVSSDPDFILDGEPLGRMAKWHDSMFLLK